MRLTLPEQPTLFFTTEQTTTVPTEFWRRPTIDAYQAIVARVKGAGLKIYGATLASPKGDPSGGYGTPAGLANRVEINNFIRTSHLFDGAADFDAATFDATTGGIWPQFVPNSTTGGTTGDYLHPNRADYQAEANSINIAPFAPGSRRKGRAIYRDDKKMSGRVWPRPGDWGWWLR